jgi:hypothetical protein
VRCCSRDSGIRSWVFWARSAAFFRSSQPSRLIQFIPNGWAPSAGGFPAMTETVAFLMKDLVLLAVSFYLLKQDVVRATLTNQPALARNEGALTIGASAH